MVRLWLIGIVLFAASAPGAGGDRGRVLLPLVWPQRRRSSLPARHADAHHARDPAAGAGNLQQPRPQRHRDAYRPKSPRQHLDVGDELVGAQYVRRHHDSQQYSHPSAHAELSYTIHYESTGRLGTFDSPNYANLATDFRYLARNVFSNPNYMRIDGRPVIFMYLSREYFKAQPGWDALANVRTIMQNEFGYDPYIVGDHFFGNIAPGAQYLDAVTAFDVYGQTFGGRPTNIASLNRLEDNYNFVDQYAKHIGVDFIPGVSPGYNDTAVRNGNSPSPRYLVDAAYGPTTQGSTLSEMLDRAVLPHTDPDIDDLIMVNSFNEWHEDTQIEATIISPMTNTDDTPTGMGYTAGYYYEGYGNLYLNILREKTLTEIPGDLNFDGKVDAADYVVCARPIPRREVTTRGGRTSASEPAVPSAFVRRRVGS